jgi:peroxiredoxin
MALFMILIGYGCKRSRQNGVKVGEAPPTFTLSMLRGDQVSLQNDFKDKVIMVRFWADWCPFCEEEMKALEPIYKKYKEKGFVILAINVAQSVKTVKKYVDRLGLSYPILLDSDSATAKNYGVAGLPTTFILDRGGIVREKLLGEASGKIFETLILNYL